MSIHTGHHGRQGHDGHGHDMQGHDKHAGHDPEMFRRRFWISLLATLPLVVTSEMVMDWFGYSIEFPGMAWVGPVLGTKSARRRVRPWRTCVVSASTWR